MDRNQLPAEEARGEAGSLSSISFDATSIDIASLPSPVQQTDSGPKNKSEALEHDQDRQDDHGLAILNLDTGPRFSIPRTPVGRTVRQRTNSSPLTPRGGHGSQSTIASPNWLLSPTETLHGTNEEATPSPDKKGSVSSPFSQPFLADYDTQHLNFKNASSPSLSSVYRPRNEQNFAQRSSRGRRDCLSMTILLLSIYSTLFSGIWWVLAISKIRYGQFLAAGGGMSPSTASLIAAAVAKTIELSFVTVFVVYLGQVLSRRTFLHPTTGIQMAEFSIRTWMMQPGTMITNWQGLRYAGRTSLGAFTLIAAITQIFYTTASDALVSPRLKLGSQARRVLSGSVDTSYANVAYIHSTCQTPISQTMDDQAGSTCIQIEHAGQAYHNYMQYLANWTDDSWPASGHTNLSSRPAPVAMLYDNTTVQGSWMYVQNTTETFEKYKRIINNVTMAMPHAGIIAAAQDPMNGIIQPQDLSGAGEYFLDGSVPSPTVHVLCASVERDEIAPLVYETWPDQSNSNPAFSDWPHGYGIPLYPDWLNSTPIDDIFGFGEKYGRRPPIFPRLPIELNTVMNASGYGERDAMYLLATSTDSKYMMCSLYSTLEPDCSTQYHSSLNGGGIASMSGGTLISKCEDPGNALAYIHSAPNAPYGFRLNDWVEVASDWAMAISLNAGLNSDNASNARLLTQLIPEKATFNPAFPTIAEALAVLAGCTLLNSAINAPFKHYFGYVAPQNILPQAKIEQFNASLSYQDYASGGTQSWQDLFYIVLVLIFLLNIFILVDLLRHGGLVTDLTEAPALFTMSTDWSQTPHADETYEDIPLQERKDRNGGKRWSYRKLWDKNH